MPIAVERLLENEIQEISRDGQETYAPQLSMSEKLAQLAHKIDFSKTKQEGEENDVGLDSLEDKSDKPLFQPSLWPWDSVRNKLRNTLTNLCVLTDVLSVARENKYLSLDAVSQVEAPPKPTVRLLTKRKNFADASKILLQGAQDMAGGLKDQQEDLSQKDFHSELMSLRQRWRLKRSGNLILGDLSYKTAGSKFWHTGAFEVRKETSAEDNDSINSVDVNISSDLNGISEVQVRIINDQATHKGSSSGIVKHINPPSFPGAVTVWHQKLCTSQKNLFCKELFAQLAHESYHGEGLSTQVVGNVIRTEIFPQTNMCITYVHMTEEECEERMNIDVQRNVDVLDFSLETLLRQQHRANCAYGTPRPVTSGIVMKETEKRRVAGPSSMIKQDYEVLITSQRLLDKLTNIAKHHILTKRVSRVIHELADDIHDPLLSCHWSTLSTETSSFATIYIALRGRTERRCFAVKVGTDTVHVTQHDGIGVTFSADTQELKLMLRNQVQLFMLGIAKKLALRLGWNVKHNTFLETTRDLFESNEHDVGILLSCPQKEREVFIEISPPSVITIKAKSPQYNDPLPKILENEPKWCSVSRNYHYFNYDKTPGRTFWDKLTIILQAS